MTATLLRAALSALALSAASANACSPGIAELRRPDGSAVAFAIEIADTPEERQLGLMFRQSLARDAGMLFIFDRAEPRSFWMQNVPISLDMLFFDDEGVLCGLVERAAPMTRAPRRSGCDARLVLEINGGLSRELSLLPGTTLRHPAVGPAACAAAP
jgi:uncharacterized membrane protein (UPF0127 family)